jgi:acyl-CoA synthetase (AMP-forming)/AMP-acid ligase II
MLAEGLRRAARRGPDRIALTIADDTWTYATLTERITAWCARLAVEGVQPGDTVGIRVDRVPDVVAVLYALWTVGAAAVPLDRSRTAELPAALHSAGATALITDDADVLADDRRVVRIIPATPPRASSPRRWSDVEPDAAALLLYTSGTTGPSKCVQFTHRAIAANAASVGAALQYTSAEHCVTPIAAELPAVLATCLLPAFNVGAAVHMLTGAMPSQVVRGAREHAATLLFAVPYVYELLCLSGSARQLPTSLRLCVASSAPTRAQTVYAFHEQSGRPIHSMYCSSEAGSIAYNDAPDVDACATSVGQALPGVDVAIAGPGDEGEVVVSGLLHATGYRNRPELSRAVFQRDGVHTGDIGALGPDGRLRLRGRLSASINHGGHQVSPEEVEAVLCDHPAVREALVHGRAHPTLYEQVVAQVVLAQPAKEPELLEHCRSALASFKVPQHIRIVDDLPRTPTGKLRRGSDR